MMVNEIKPVISWFLKHGNVWSDYDTEADTLSLHFKKPNHADRTEMTKGEIIIRYEEEMVVGKTILNAGKRNFRVSD